MKEEEFQEKMRGLHLPEADLRDFATWSYSFLNCADDKHEFCEHLCIDQQRPLENIQYGFYRSYNHIKPCISEELFCHDSKMWDIIPYQTQWLQCAKLIACAKSARKVVHNLCEDTDYMYSNLELLTRQRFFIKEFNRKDPFEMLGDLYTHILNIALFRYSHYAHVLVRAIISNNYRKEIPKQVVARNIYMPIILVKGQEIHINNAKKQPKIREIEQEINSIMKTGEMSAELMSKSVKVQRPTTPDPNKRDVKTPPFSYFDYTNEYASGPKEVIVTEKADEEIVVTSIGNLNLRPVEIICPKSQTELSTSKVVNILSEATVVLPEKSEVVSTNSDHLSGHKVTQKISSSNAKGSSEEVLTSASDGSTDSDTSEVGPGKTKNKRQLSCDQPSDHSKKKSKTKVTNWASCSSGDEKETKEKKKRTVKKGKAKKSSKELIESLFTPGPQEQKIVILKSSLNNPSETKLNLSISDDEDMEMDSSVIDPSKEKELLDLVDSEIKEKSNNN
jgi:hypothetical protein